MRPVFVVGALTDLDLVADTLALAPEAAGADTAAPDALDLVPALHPVSRGWVSGRLSADDVTPDVVHRLADALIARSRDRDDRPAATDALVVDWSARHALRVPFLAAAFPDARFVYVHRRTEDSLTGALSAWLSQRAVAYPALPDWPGPRWTGPLVPDWRDLAGRPLNETVAAQWRTATAILLADLDDLPGDRWAVVSYERLVADPQREASRLTAFLGLDWDRTLSGPLRGRAWLADTAVDSRAVEFVLPLVADASAMAADVLGEDDVPAPVTPGPSPLLGPFESRHSQTFPALLRELGVSLLVSTYQSGRVILCRADDEGLNTHFRMLPVPMGIAVDATRVTIGTERRIFTYRNHPGAVPHLGDSRYDACYLPLHMHVSGNIQVHELAYVADELWAVSTRFSCLATFDDDHSFTPRWRPPFISALAAEDRCHLNGMAVVDDRIGYASALGLTDVPGGWRDGKGVGGVVLEVPSGEPVVRELSMPHSPRWHDGRLWVLESGKGALGVADLESGRVETVVELPGFTRGLAFAGAFAFVGLSQVRESVFRGLPIVERQHRQCGVSVVDLRGGTVVATLVFTGSVQEIFDVQVLPKRWPELGELDGELLERSFVLPPGAAGA